MKHERETEALLRRMRPVSPEAALRARILAQAATVHGPGVSWSDRVWASRPLRWAWAAALVGLIVASQASDRAVISRLARGAVDQPAIPPAVDLCTEEPAVCGMQARFRNGPLDDGSAARRRALEENL